MNNLLHTVKRTLVTPRIAHTRTQLAFDQKKSFVQYPLIGSCQTKLGTIFLNKPQNNNLLTEQCTDELFRFINSYHHDHTVENVYIQNRGSVVFSGGADYQQLVDSQIYLDKLYRCAIMVGQSNKPVFCKVNGSVRGIAAYLLNMLTMPLGTPKSSLRLDETERGFIPIIGGSYHLAHIPCHIGMYLSLTGRKLNKDEMARMGYLKGMIRDQFSSREFRKKLSDANLFMQNPFPATTNNLSQTRKDSMVKTKMNQFYNMMQASQKQLFSTKRNFYAKFAMNQYRIAKTQFENILNPHGSFSQQYNRQINNYYQMRYKRPLKFLKQSDMLQQASTQQPYLAGLPIQKLVSIFGQKSITDVMRALQEDGSDWAKKTKNEINSKDPLAVHLTFNLIKGAQGLSWVEALQREYTLARRLLKVSTVQLQVNQKGSRKILRNPYSNKKLNQIQQSEIYQKFLKTSQQNVTPQQLKQQTLIHDTPQHSLLPTNKYYNYLPDSVRHYLNRQFFDDIHYKNSAVQVKRFLQLNQINYNDQSYNVNTLRQRIYEDMKYLELYAMQEDRIKGVLCKSFKGGYDNLKQKRINYMKQRMLGSSNKDDIMDTIVDKITQVYQGQLLGRFQAFQRKTAAIAGKQYKMQIFRNYQKTLIDNIVLNGANIQKNNLTQLSRHSGLVRFDGQAPEGGNIYSSRQTPQQIANDFTQDLKKLYQQNSLSQIPKEFADRYHPQNTPLAYPPSYDAVTKQRQPYQQQIKEQIKDRKVMYRYNKSTQIRNRVLQYRYLIQKASKTSQQMAGMLSWSDDDVQAVLVNAPKPAFSHIQFAKQITRNTKSIQQSIQQYNKLYQQTMMKKQQSLQNQLHQNKKYSPFQKGSARMFLFDIKRIPRPFRKVYLVLLESVIKYFTASYNNQMNNVSQMLGGSDKNNKTISALDRWVQNSITTDFTQFIKHDVEYVFSYLTILHIRDVLDSIRNLDQYQPIQALVQLTGYQFDSEEISQENIQNQLISFLYSIMDMHSDAKQRILLPQTKLIDFINRQKLTHELTNQYQTFSFQTLMLLIARDRKRIRDIRDNKKQILGYDPQYTLSALKSQYKTIGKMRKYPLKDQFSNEGVSPLSEQFKNSQQMLAEYDRQVDQEQYIRYDNRDRKNRHNNRNQQVDDDNDMLQAQTTVKQQNNSWLKANSKTDANINTQSQQQQQQHQQQQQAQSFKKQSQHYEIPFPVLTPQQQLAINIQNPTQNTTAQQHIQMLLIQHIPKQQENSKRLVTGYISYLVRLERMLHQAAAISNNNNSGSNKGSISNDASISHAHNNSFMPDWSCNNINKHAYQQLKTLLRTDHSSDQQWFNQQLQKCIKSLLAFRMDRQKYMSKVQLIQFDKQFYQLFQPDMLLAILIHHLKREQQICRQLVKQPRQYSADDIDNNITSNDNKQDMYLQLKNSVKSPKSLQLLNNLLLTQNTMKDRFHQVQLQVTKKKKDPQNVPNQLQFRQLRQHEQYYEPTLSQSTYSRLIRQTFSYSDDYDYDDKDRYEGVKADMNRAMGVTNATTMSVNANNNNNTNNNSTKNTNNNMKNTNNNIKNTKNNNYNKVPTTAFLDEVKSIKQMLTQKQLKQQIQMRIKHLQMIQ